VFYLALHPDIQERARQEALSLFRDLKDPSELSVSDLQRLPFITACVREALRMNSPTTTALPRISPNPMPLGSYIIPPNTPTFLNMYIMGRSAQNWDDPDIYYPDRFLDDTNLEAWQPFGVGPRRCPAANFALAEQRTMLAILLSRFTWTLPKNSAHATSNGIRNAPSAFSLNLPKGVILDFSPIKM
jgi:cytochrome P450